MPLLVREARLAERMHRIRSSGSVLVGVASHLVVVTMRCDRRRRGYVDLGVSGARGARDVGDRGDVIPVESMTESERDHAEKQADETQVHGSQPTERPGLSQPAAIV